VQSSPPVQPATPNVLLKMRLDLGNPDDMSDFLARARQALWQRGGGTINVALVREDDDA